MTARQLLTAPQVAAQLGHRAAWFYRNRARLQQQHGFPPPVDGCGLRWDPVAIGAWLDRRAHTPAPAADPEQVLIGRARALAAEAELAALGGEP